MTIHETVTETMSNVFYLIASILFISGCSKESTGFEKIYLLEDDYGNSGSSRGIKIYSENPWYWEYRGKPVLLLGGSYEDNMFQFPNWYYGHNTPGLSVGMTDWTLEQHLDKLVEVGGNYIRGSLSCRNYGNRFPYLKITGTPGNNFQKGDVYDLDRWDEEYWNRLDNFLKMCYDRGIVVSVELFDRFDLMNGEAHESDALRRGNRNSGWPDHPWNPDRNINYTVESSGLPNVAPAEQWWHKLWLSVPAFNGHSNAPEPIVLGTLKRYVDKVLEYTLKYDNILYIIENETYQPLEFGEFWVDYINERAAEKGKTVYVTNMVGQPDPHHERQQTVRRTSKYSFYDFSQNNHNTGQVHYDNILAAKADIADVGTETGIKPVNFVKIYGSAQYGSVQDAKERFWRGIFAGVASARFHRPAYGEYYWGLGLNEDAQAQIRSVRMLQEEMNIFTCEPLNRLLGNRSDNEAYCLAEIGKQYAVYFTDGGSVTLDLSGASGSFNMRWLEIAGSKWGSTNTIEGGGIRTLTPPSSGQWVVLITK